MKTLPLFAVLAVMAASWARGSTIINPIDLGGGLLEYKINFNGIGNTAAGGNWGSAPLTNSSGTAVGQLTATTNPSAITLENGSSDFSLSLNGTFGFWLGGNNADQPITSSAWYYSPGMNASAPTFTISGLSSGEKISLWGTYGWDGSGRAPQINFDSLGNVNLNTGSNSIGTDPGTAGLVPVATDVVATGSSLSGVLDYPSGGGEAQLGAMIIRIKMVVDKIYDSGGTVTLSSTLDYPGATILSNGTTVNANALNALGNATLGSPLIFLGSTNKLNMGANQTIGSLTGNGTLDVSSYGLILVDNSASFIDGNGTNIGNNTFSGNITGSGTINKTGNQTLTLSGSGNTFNGTLTVSAGTLALGNVNAVQNATLVANSTVTFDAGGNYTVGSLGGSANLNNNSNKIVIGANNASTTYSGSLSGSGEIQKNGSGTLTLSGSNAFTGDLRFDTGTILVGHNDALGSSGSGAIVIHSAGSGQTLAASGASSYMVGRAMSIDNDLTLGQSATNTGSLDFSGAIALGNETRTLTTDTNTSHTFSGDVSGTGGIIKAGSGTLTLSGSNTYAGATTINAGTLLVNGNSSSTTVTANAGVIGGTGSVGDLVVNSGARVAPGVAGAIGTLSANTLTLAGGAGYTWQIGNVSGTAGTNWDLLNIGGGNGTASISATSGNKFTIYVTSTGIPTSWSPGGNGSWKIINWGTVTGFDAAAFAIDTSGFGGLLTGTWSVSNTDGFLNLAYAGVAVPTWNGGTGDWSTGFTQPPVNADNIFFAGASAATATNDISSLNTVANITFESTAGAFTLAANSGSAGYDASSALAITGFILNSSNADQTLNTALSFGGNSTIYASSGNLIFSGPLANAQTLTIADNGGVQVTGAISNNGTILQSGNGSTSVIGAISGSGVLTKNGTGTLTLSGANTYTGVTTINAGTLALSGGSAIVDSGTVALNSGGTLTLGSAETIGSVTGAGNIILNANLNTGGANTNDTLSGTISGTGELQKAGSGTLTLSGSNSFTGLLSHGDGTILIGNNNAAGASGSGEILIHEDGGAKSIAAAGTSNYTISRAMNISNDLNLGQSTTNTGELTFSGAIALGVDAGQTRTLNVAANNTHQLSGVVASGGHGIVKAGTGTLILSGNNTYIGSTILNAGTIQLSHSNGLGTTGNVTFGGGTLLYGSGVTTDLSSRMKNSSSAIAVDTNGQTITFASAIDDTNTGGLTKTGAGTLILSANNTYTGTTTLSSGSLHIGDGGTSGSLASASVINNGILEFNRSDSITFSGNITGSGNLTKLGNGDLTLSGSSSTYTGSTIISAGRLIVGTDNALGSGLVSIKINNNGLDLNGKSVSNSAIAFDAVASILMNSSPTKSIISGNLTHLTSPAYISNAGDIEVMGAVSGSSAFELIKEQNGALVLSGTTDNSNFGLVIYNGATVTLNKTSSGSVHAIGNGIIVNNSSATIKLSGAGDDQIFDANTVEINSGSLDMNGRNETFSNLRLNGSGNGTGALVNTLANSTSTLSAAIQIGLSDSTPGNAVFGGDGHIIINGVISENGSRSLTKAGSGKVSLTGANTFTGGLFITSGTLQIGNSGTTGSLSASSAITNNATLVFNRTDTLTQGTDFASVISGTGNLIQAGTGSLILNAANTYSGGTTLNSGTLTLNNASAAGTGTLTQSSGASLLHLNATGTFANAMSVYNVKASETLTLSGGITVNNATFDVDNGDTLTISNTVNGTGGVTKNGTGTLVLSGSNTFSGATTVNDGTLEITSMGALGGTSAVNVDGGSLLVRAAGSINDSAAMNLGGGTLSLNGTFNESVGALTLSVDSIIDVKNFSGNLTFSALGNWLAGTSLAITNWTGFNKYGTQIGDLAYNPHIIFTDTTNLSTYSDRIRFYSGDFGQGFAGTAFDAGFGQIKPVPEPETWATAVLLLIAGVWWTYRKRAKAM